MQQLPQTRDTFQGPLIGSEVLLQPIEDFSIVAGRFGQVQDVAPMAAFLRSDAAAYITGAVIQVDGGLAM